MQQRRMGRTGLKVSEICLGTMTFGGAGKAQWDHIGGLDSDASGRILSTALGHGVNLIDTADMYADGECERSKARDLSQLGSTHPYFMA